ncbi:MAG: hypothetical protein HKN23_08780 [Verrucomicrobiales bacterium]|nr:hypothetical protein [Verrucomicrobiales bacterium]
MKREDQFNAAEGYVELGMYQEALEELSAIPVEVDDKQTKFEIADRRLKILQQMEAWEEGAKVARAAVVELPNYSTPYLLGAYAIRRAEGVEAAFEFLVSGEHCLYMTPDFWYKKGCYYCLLGQFKEAKECVYKAMGSGDEKYDTLVEEDDDLAPLRGTWDLT